MGKGRKNKKEKAFKPPPPAIPAIIYKPPPDRTMLDETPKLIPPDTFQTIAEEMLQTLPTFRNVFMTMCEYRIKDINPQHKETKESPTHMIIFCLRVVCSDQFHPLGVVQIDKRIDQTDKLLEVWKAFIYDLSLLRLIVIGSISPPTITFYKILSQLTNIPKLEEYSGPIVYSVWPFKEIVHLYDYYHLLQETQETIFERSDVCFMAYPPSEEQCPLELWKASWTDILLVLASQSIYCYYTTEDENAPPIGIFFADFYKHYQRARRDGVIATDTRTSTDRLMEIVCPFTTLLHSHKPFMTPGDLQHFYETNEDLRWLLASAKFRKLNPKTMRRTMPSILRKSNYCKVSNELLNVPSNYKPKSVLDEISFSAESSPSNSSIEITESQMETIFKLIDRSIVDPTNSNQRADPFEAFLKKVTYDDYDLFLKTSTTDSNATQPPKSTNNEELTKPPEKLVCPHLSNATEMSISDKITKPQLTDNISTKPSSSTTKLTNNESTNSEISSKIQLSKADSDKEVTRPCSEVPSKKGTNPQQPNNADIDVQNKSSKEHTRPQSSKAVSNNKTIKPHRSRSQELNEPSEKLFKPYKSQTIDNKDSSKPEPLNAVTYKEVTKQYIPKANNHKESKKAQSKKVTESKPVNDVCDKEGKLHMSKVVSDNESKMAQSREMTKLKPFNDACDKEVTKLHTCKKVSHKESKTTQIKENPKLKTVNNDYDREVSKEVSHTGFKIAQSKEITKSEPVNDVCDKEVTKLQTCKEVSHKGSKTSQNKETSKQTPFNDVCHKEVTESQLSKATDNENFKIRKNFNDKIVLHDHDYFQSESSGKSIKKRATKSTIYNLVKDYFGEALNKQINIGNSPKKLFYSNFGDILANTNNKSKTNWFLNGKTYQESTRRLSKDTHLIVDTNKLKNDSDINIDLSGVLQTIAEHYQEDKMELKISVVNSLDKTCKFLKLPKACIIQKNVSDNTKKTANKKNTVSIQSIHIPKGMRGKKWKARRIKARQHAHRLVFNASQMVPVKVKKRRNNWTKINRTFKKARQGVLSDFNSSDDCENKKTDSLKTVLKTDEFPSRLLQRKRKEFVKQHVRHLCCKSKNSILKGSGCKTYVKGKNGSVEENEDNKTGSRATIENKSLSPKKNTNTAATVTKVPDNSVESGPWRKTNKTYKNSKKANRNGEKLDVKSVDTVDFSIKENFKSETNTDSTTAVNNDPKANVVVTSVQNKSNGGIDAKNDQGGNIKLNKDADSTVVCEKGKTKSDEDLAYKTSKNYDSRKNRDVISVEYGDSKISKNTDSTTISKNNDVNAIKDIKFEVSIKTHISNHTEINNETDASSDVDSIDSLEELAVSLENKKNPAKLPSKYIIPKIPRVSLPTISQRNDPKVKTLDECKPLTADLHNGFGTFTNGNTVNGHGKFNGSHSGDSGDSESHDSLIEKKILGINDHPDKSKNDNSSKKNEYLCDNDLKTCIKGNLYDDKNCADGCNKIENNLYRSSKLKKSSVQIPENKKYNCSTSHVESQKAVDQIKTDKNKLFMDSSVNENDDDFYTEAKEIFETSQKYTTGEKEQIVAFLDLIESSVTDDKKIVANTDKTDLSHHNVKKVLTKAENICREPLNLDHNVLPSVKDDSTTRNVGNDEFSNSLDGDSANNFVSQKNDAGNIVMKSSIKKDRNEIPSKSKDVIINMKVDSLTNDITSKNTIIEKDISNEVAKATEIDYYSDDSLESEIPNEPVCESRQKSNDFVINMDTGLVDNGLSVSRKSMSEDSIDKLDNTNTVVNKCSGIVEDSFNNLRSAVYILKEISDLNRSIVNENGSNKPVGSTSKGARGPAEILRDIQELNHMAESIVSGEIGDSITRGFSKTDFNNHISAISKKLGVNNSFPTATGVKNEIFESIDYKEYKRSLEVCDNRESNCDIIYKDRDTFNALYGEIPGDFETLRLSNDWLCTLKGYVKLKEVLITRKVKCFHATALNLEHVDFFVHLIKKGKNHVPSSYHGQTYRFLDYRCAFDLLALGQGVYVVSKDHDVEDKVS